jgi:hypothetical protein
MSTVLAPAIPHWIAAERKEWMQVDSGIPKCIGFLGAQNARGFGAEGTAFFVFVTQEELDFTYMVTCRHVVRPFDPSRSSDPNPAKIWVRAATKRGHPPRLIETIRGDWICHPDRTVDICAHIYDHVKWDSDDVMDIHRLEIGTIVLRRELEDTVGLSLGDEVFIPSVFVGRVGETQNIPVIRIGNIAAMPDEPIWTASSRHPAYLIETRSLGGVSGAPVFLHIASQRHMGRPDPYPEISGRIVTPYFLIGMMQGFHSGQYAGDFVSEDGEEKIVPVDTDFNAGIGIALPVTLILDTLNHPTLVESRMATIQAKKKDSGYRDASAVPRQKPDPQATDENPNHREDFTSLLNAAARKPEPKA